VNLVTVGTILVLAGHSFIVKLDDHDIRAPILGMGLVMAIQRCIRIFFNKTANRHSPGITLCITCGKLPKL
jgi:hypothetical protein